MQKPKLDILFAFFAYGGNGGVAMQLPSITTWFAKNFTKLNADERVGRIAAKQYGDIPLSMERNRVVKDAKDQGFDVIVMIDSDNVPDLYVGNDDNAKPFIETSFDFLYERMLRSIPTVVCAPYCGPPPHPVKGGEENVYVFYATASESDDSDPDNFGSVKFQAYSRVHASTMSGIQACAAGPTGCIMYSTDAFDLMPIHGLTDEEVLRQHKDGEISTLRAKELLRMESWFFYEYTDQYQTRKASTEDVTNTREIQFAGTEKHGEPVVFCNWDAWAGHYKPKCVGAPKELKIEQVSNLFAEAVRNNVSETEKNVVVDFGGDLDEKQFTETKQAEPSMSHALPVGNIPDDPCQNAAFLIKRINSSRVMVIGDNAGQVVNKLSDEDSSSPISVYTIGLSSGAKCPDAKRVNGLGSPDEAAAKLPDQDLDAVVLVKSDNSVVKDFHETSRQWLRHIKPKGYLIVVSQEPMDQEFVSSELEFEGYDTLISESQDFCMIRREVEDDSSDM